MHLGSPQCDDSEASGLCVCQRSQHMSSDYHTTKHPDLTDKQAVYGAGMATTWRCLGCGIGRPLQGSRGAGIRKRCAQCVETAKAKA